MRMLNLMITMRKIMSKMLKKMKIARMLTTRMRMKRTKMMMMMMMMTMMMMISKFI